MTEGTAGLELTARRERFEAQVELLRGAIRSDLGLRVQRRWVLPFVAAAGGFALALAVGRRRRQRRNTGL
jgi:hypothetical protein